MLIVTVDRNRQIRERSSQTHAELLLPSAISRTTAKALSSGDVHLQRLYKEFTIHDEDGNPVGKRREPAGTVTVLRLDEPTDVEDLSLDVAVACGHKTSSALVQAWVALHPRSPFVTVVWYALGDWRDRDLFMNWTNAAGGDYTRNRSRALDGDAPVLTREQIDALTRSNRQKDDAAKAKASASLAEETSSQRLYRLEAMIERVRRQLGEAAAAYVEKDIRQERRIMLQRVERAERRKS